MHEALLHPVMIHKGTPTLSNQNKFCKILSLYLRKKRKQNLPVQTFAIYLFRSSLYSFVGALNVKSDLWVLNLFSLYIFKTSLFLEKAEPGLRWISWLKNSLSPDLQDITETLAFRLNQPRMPAVNKHVQQRWIKIRGIFTTDFNSDFTSLFKALFQSQCHIFWA